MVAPARPSTGTLTRTAAFRAVYARGRWAHGPTLSVGVLPSRRTATSVGLRTRRNLKGAVVRNRLKRQLRAILHIQRAAWRPGLDIVIVIHPKQFPVRAATLQRELQHLAKRARLLG